MEDIEEDPTLRKHINIYKQPTTATPAAAVAAVVPADEDGELEEGAPAVSLEEMLDELCLEETPMEE